MCWIFLKCRPGSNILSVSISLNADPLNSERVNCQHCIQIKSFNKFELIMEQTVLFKSLFKREFHSLSESIIYLIMYSYWNNVLWESTNSN